MTSPVHTPFTIYFNPRSREGSDFSAANMYVCKRISIHAPARGATRQRDRARKQQPISIHAPARGATGITHSAWSGLLISIHAPARGATGSEKHANREPDQFQSTLPRGERPSGQLTFIDSKRFQSTLPRGERRS